jgi:hypothetical protein
VIKGCFSFEFNGVPIDTSAEKCVCFSKSGVLPSIEAFTFGDFVFFAGVPLGIAIGFQAGKGADSGSVCGVGETSDRADLKNRENITSCRYGM